MNTMTRALVKTTSGFPGRLETCFLNRSPLRWSSERTALSIPVSFPLTRDMQKLRWLGVRLSVTSLAGQSEFRLRTPCGAHSLRDASRMRFDERRRQRVADHQRHSDLALGCERVVRREALQQG